MIYYVAFMTCFMIIWTISIVWDAGRINPMEPLSEIERTFAFALFLVPILWGMFLIGDQS